MPRKEILYQIVTAPVSTSPETPQVDKWATDTEVPLFRTKEQRYTYSSSFFDPKPIPPAGETITVDKWVTDTEIPLPRPKEQRYTYPSFTIDPQALTKPEAPHVDGWFVETSRPRWDVKRQQYTYPSTFFDPNPLSAAEVVTMDKWFVDNQRPKWDAKRQQYTYPSYSSSDFVSIDIPVFSGTNSVNITYTREMQYQMLVNPLQALPETVTMDKWIPETQRPRFDQRRQQYLYPTFLVDPLQLLQKYGPPIPQPKLIFVDGDPAIQLSGKFYTLV